MTSRTQDGQGRAPATGRAAPLLEARGLTVRFGKVTALDGLDLIAPPGEVLAILGPNGAGKTTFVRTVATLVRPTAGELRVLGTNVARDPMAVRRDIGLAGQFAAVEPAMTGRENLRMVARLFGLSRRQAAASTVMCNAVRSLALGGPAAAGLGHTTTYWVVLSLLWSAVIALVFGSLAVALQQRKA